MAEKVRVIDEERISMNLEGGRGKSREEVLGILEKAKEAKGLEPEEAAVLLQTEDPGLLREIYQTARGVKMRIYGKRLVLFAPLYLSNYCVNNCRYCGFRRDNRLLPRKRLNMEEIRDQVQELEKLGHKRLLVECGESSLSDMDYVEEAIATIYDTKIENGEIRRVNVNIAATTVDEYSGQKAATIET